MADPQSFVCIRAAPLELPSADLPGKQDWNVAKNYKAFSYIENDQTQLFVDLF